MIIQNEALKMIDLDYDVLYLLIKDKLVEKNISIENALSKYIDQDKLDYIALNLPTLTIYVPELPLKTFSAETWNASEEIPAVTYVSTKSESTDLPIYFFDEGEQFIDDFRLEADLIPTYPILVVKTNERIIAEDKNLTKNPNLTKNNSEENSKRIGSTSLLFIDSAFDNLNKAPMTKGRISSRPSDGPTDFVPTNLDYSKLLKAYDYFGTAGWQRDYIYYDMTPTTTKGVIDNAYMEHLVSFEMIGDRAIDKISDQTGDPSAIENVGGGGGSRGGGRYTDRKYWTDGQFEFLIIVDILSGKRTYLSVDPDLIFDRNYETVGNYLKIKSVTPKRYILTKPLPLFDWDLSAYSARVTVSIEEVDPSETITRTLSSSFEFATNFSAEPSFGGEKAKVGLKFGGSTKSTKTSTYTIVTQKGNDELGNFIMNFGDPVILNKNIDANTNTYYPTYNKIYTTGWCRLCIAPLKIY